VLYTISGSTSFRCWVSHPVKYVWHERGLTRRMALIHELRNGQSQTTDTSESGHHNTNNNSNSNSNPTDIFLLSMSRQNFQAVLNAVFKMEQYWAGVSGVSQLLEKRESPLTSFLSYLRGYSRRIVGYALIDRFWSCSTILSSTQRHIHFFT
jgi:hypothetical protein